MDPDAPDQNPPSLLPDEAYALAMALLPDAGPARLLAIHRAGPLGEMWHRIRSGTVHKHPGLADRLGDAPARTASLWSDAARGIDPRRELERHRDAGLGVASLSTPGMPAVLAADHLPPTVLVSTGDPDVIVGPRVAIVGTRRCTYYGRDVAFDLGRDLALAGVSVVSGLALGVDAAAHCGALSVDGAPPIAVVGSGHDRIYPRANGGLWRSVAARGVVLSEYPLGSAPLPWHFPSRNRLIAALADVVVVVESRRHGGSMHTVEEAERRGRDIMAVPGSIRSAASEGTNQLLCLNIAPVCSVADVLIRLGMSPGAHRKVSDPRTKPGPVAGAVLECIEWQPITLEQLVLRAGRPVGEVVVALDELVGAGWVAERGGWIERVAKGESA